MVGVRKVHVCDTPVGILQHRTGGAPKVLGLTRAKSGKHVSTRLSALPLIIEAIYAAFFQPAFAIAAGWFAPRNPSECLRKRHQSQGHSTAVNNIVI